MVLLLADHVRGQRRIEQASAHGFEHIALINPMATLLTQMGHAFIDPSDYPSAGDGGRRSRPVVLAIAIIPAMFALGWWYFTREAPRVAENL